MANMSQANLCRLCVHHLSKDAKSLYDENGFGNDLYEIIFKYFHPTIVNMDKWKELTGICLRCWHYIWDFHNFQGSVVVAQAKLTENPDMLVKTQEDYDFALQFQQPKIIKVEGDFISLPEMEALEAGGDTSFSSAELRSKKSSNKFKTPSMASGPLGAKDHPDFIAQPKFELIDVSSDNGGCTDDEDLPSTSGRAIKIETEDFVLLSDDSDQDVEEGDDDYEIAGISRNMTTKSFEEDNYSDWNDSSDEDNGIKTNTTRAERNEELDELMAKWMPNLKCGICSLSCTNWPLLQDHYRQRHPNDECYISCCGRKLKEHWTIKEHLRFHNDPKIFQCKLCDKCHSTKCSLKRHIDVHHPEIQPIVCICKLCGKGFTTKSGLNYHSTTVHDSSHKPERIKLANGHIMFRCKECGKKFNSAGPARQHVWYNHRYKPKYPCTICTKSFRQPRQLREHMAAHMGKPLYACVYCPTTFTYFNSLQVHRKAKHATENDENFYRMLEDH